MDTGRSPRPSAAPLVVLAVLLVAGAAAVGWTASIFLWDPNETCRTRGGGHLTSETLLGNPLCSDGSTVQPMWMTVTTTAALIAAVVCVTVAVFRHARRDDPDDRDAPPPTASHWS